MVPSVALAALLALPGFELTARFEKDIPYETVDDSALKLDLVRPAGAGPHPCVVCLHGGAWKGGSRRDVAWFCRQLADEGYVAAAVGYRLAPKNKWPAQIEDVKTAVRFLRKNAEKYGIDPARIAAMGFSAGGHLAALLGTTDTEAGFDGKLYRDQSSRVQCVVDFFGPADLTLYTETPGIEAAMFKPFLGTSYRNNPDVYKKASPIEHVTKDDPPFLIVHGTADIIVPIIHSERLHERLTKAGVKSELITVKGAGHGWTGKDAVSTTAATLEFLSKNLLHLAGNRAEPAGDKK
jgi:acetyl esterase/lipase